MRPYDRARSGLSVTAPMSDPRWRLCDESWRSGIVQERDLASPSLALVSLAQYHRRGDHRRVRWWISMGSWAIPLPYRSNPITVAADSSPCVRSGSCTWRQYAPGAVGQWGAGTPRSRSTCPCSTPPPSCSTTSSANSPIVAIPNTANSFATSMRYSSAPMPYTLANIPDTAPF